MSAPVAAAVAAAAADDLLHYLRDVQRAGTHTDLSLDALLEACADYLHAVCGHALDAHGVRALVAEHHALRTHPLCAPHFAPTPAPPPPARLRAQARASDDDDDAAHRAAAYGAALDVEGGGAAAALRGSPPASPRRRADGELDAALCAVRDDLVSSVNARRHELCSRGEHRCVLVALAYRSQLHAQLMGELRAEFARELTAEHPSRPYLVEARVFRREPPWWFACLVFHFDCDPLAPQ